MKISDLAGASTMRRESNNTQTPSGFDALLFGTNTSGDEYYWQHQEQLQQSCLSFNRLNIEAHETLEQKGAQKTDEEIKNNDWNAPYITADKVMPDDAKHSSYTTVLPLGTVNKQVLESAQKSIGLSTTQKPIDTTKPEEQSQRSQRPYCAQEFKTHHLFIKEQTAELSFSEHRLKPEEKKELTQLIKAHLKRKGIALKQLIINGVHHD